MQCSHEMLNNLIEVIIFLKLININIRCYIEW